MKMERQSSTFDPSNICLNQFFYFKIEPKIEHHFKFKSKRKPEHELKFKPRLDPKPNPYLDR